MKILQFGVWLDNNPQVPAAQLRANFIVYPGTHDNNTVIGWFNEAVRTGGEMELSALPGHRWHDLAWDFIRMAWGSVANQAVACLQDVMSLGNEARMNFPSMHERQLAMALHAGDADRRAAARLRELTVIYDRHVKAKKVA